MAALQPLTTILVHSSKGSQELSLPSRRQPPLSINWLAHPDGKSERLSVLSIAQLEATFEYVHFQDLLPYLGELLDVNVKPIVYQGSVTYPGLANYRFSAFFNGIPYLTLFIRFDGAVLDTTKPYWDFATGGGGNLELPVRQIPFGPLKNRLKEVKVYDYSVVYTVQERLKGEPLNVQGANWTVPDVNESRRFVGVNWASTQLETVMEEEVEDLSKEEDDFCNVSSEEGNLIIDEDGDLSSPTSESSLDEQSNPEAEQCLPERNVLDDDDEEEDELLTVYKKKAKPPATIRSLKSTSPVFQALYQEYMDRVDPLSPTEYHPRYLLDLLQEMGQHPQASQTPPPMTTLLEMSMASSDSDSFTQEDTETAMTLKRKKLDDDDDLEDEEYSKAQAELSVPGPSKRFRPDEDEERCILGTLLSRLPLDNLPATVAYMKANLVLSKWEITRRTELVTAIETTLNRNGLPCKLHLFGSTLNGLGLPTTSDIDLYVQMYGLDTPTINGHLARHLGRINSILRSDQSYLTGLTGYQADPKTPLHIETLLGDGESPEGHMRVPLVRLKVPFLGLPGTERFIQLDLNLNHPLGVVNTRLIRFLSKLEPRFFALNVLLRYWIKADTALKKSDGLSSYALTNLVLYYFQRRSPPLLPPIDYLITLHPSPETWSNGAGQAFPCNFCRDMNRVDFFQENDETLLQLLAGFFAFYADYDFPHRRISTRNGWAEPLPRRPAHPLYPDRPARPFLNLMDPFETSHNLAYRMGWQRYQRLLLELRKAKARYCKYI